MPIRGALRRKLSEKDDEGKSIVKKKFFRAVKTAGKELTKGAKAAGREIEKHAKNYSRKKKIVNRMSDRHVSKMARYFDIRSFDYDPYDGKKYRRKPDDYREIIARNIPIEDVIQYAKKDGVRVDDVIEAMQKDKTKEEMRGYEESGVTDLIKEIIVTIRDFRPERRHKQEFRYQIELTGFLKKQFPQTRIEERRGSSRPDIVIGNVAIEIKGPTRVKDLDTIASKLARYGRHYPGGVIAVLFSVEVNEKYYKEWESSITESFPNAFIIRI